VVPDARQDERFKQLPQVTEGGLRFYAGAPLINPAGHALGVLCVLDYQPREPSTGQLAALRSLADHVMKLLEMRRARTAPLAAAVPPAASAVAVPSDGGCRVLVVDDDDIIRSFVRKLVARLGYRVIEATNGAEALTQIEKHPEGIGVVLTDVTMPVMDGLTLVRILKKLPVPPAIVVMSGRFDSSLRSALRAEGVTALLGKPFSTDELELTLLQAKAPAS
jgi:CheY-like chemotaxis protein